MPKYDLVGQDGNAFALMGYTARALRNEGLGNLVSKMQKEATSGDYWNLIAVCDEYVQMANEQAGDYSDEDEDDIEFFEGYNDDDDDDELRFEDTGDDMI